MFEVRRDQLERGRVASGWNGEERLGIPSTLVASSVTTFRAFSEDLKKPGGPGILRAQCAGPHAPPYLSSSGIPIPLRSGSAGRWGGV